MQAVVGLEPEIRDEEVWWPVEEAGMCGPKLPTPLDLG